MKTQLCPHCFLPGPEGGWEPEPSPSLPALAPLSGKARAVGSPFALIMEQEVRGENCFCCPQFSKGPE